MQLSLGRTTAAGDAFQCRNVLRDMGL